MRVLGPAFPWGVFCLLYSGPKGLFKVAAIHGLKVIVEVRAEVISHLLKGVHAKIKGHFERGATGDSHGGFVVSAAEWTLEEAQVVVVDD